MLFRTHLAITTFFFLLFFQNVQNPVLFLLISASATILPDIDTKFSRIGHYKLSRIFNFFAKHRGMMHSFTFLSVIAVFLFSVSMQILIPFVLGYSLHLLADGLTLKGVKLFYPSRIKMKGMIKTGGIAETFIFVFFLSGNLFLFLKIF